MMHQSNRRGSVLLVMRVRGLGPIKRATGIDPKDPKALEKLADMKAMIRTLRVTRRDLLKGLLPKHLGGGWLGLPALYSAHRTGRLEDLPLAEELPALGPLEGPPRHLGAVGKWLAGLGREVAAGELSRDHLTSYRVAWRRLLSYGPAARMSDIPALVRSDRGETVGHARKFNYARSAAQAFLTATLGQSHRLWLAVTDVPPRTYRRVRQPEPLEPAEVERLTPELWAMAVTGMLPSEFYGRWEELRHAGRVHIHGTKREGRDRIVPWVGLLATPVTPIRKLAAELARLFPGRVLKDLRNTYATLLEQAGIPRTRRKLYLGHGKSDVTDLYEQHDVARFLAEDTAALRRLLGRTDRAQFTLLQGG